MDLKRIYLNNYNKESLQKTVRNHYTDEKSSVLMRAEDLLKGKYIFQNEWDMERSQVPVLMPLESVDWNYIPGLDMEWAYMFHRHHYLPDLILAYLFTDDLKYIEYLKRFMLQYIEENPYNETNKPFSYRTIDVALRLQAWVKVVEMLNILEFDVEGAILDEMAVYHDYLMERIAPSRSQSNWVAIECSAILLYQEQMQKTEHQESVLSLYEMCLENQVLDDGLQWEQSFMYHHEVLITALHAISAIGKDKSSRVYKSACAMALASSIIMRTDGTQSNFGDSDYECMHSLMLASEKLLGIDLFHYPVKSSLYDFMFTGNDNGSLGLRDAAAVEQLNLETNGIAMVKHHDTNTTLMFAHGPLGGGHGHDDFLHLDWMINGKNVLVDSGRYTYHEENMSRLKYKSPLAHNVPVLNHQPYNKHIDSWSSEKVARGFGEKVVYKDRVALFEGGHFGYSTNQEQIYIYRSAIYIDDSILITIDSLKAGKQHQLSSNFVFAKPNLSQDDGHLRYDDEGVSLYVYPLTQGSNIQIETHTISPQYNLEQETLRLNLSQELQEGSITTLFSTHHMEDLCYVDVFDDSGNVYDKSVVECIRYNSKEYVSYVLVQHQEPNDSRRTYCVDGHYIYGRIVYYETYDDEIIYKQVLY